MKPITNLLGVGGFKPLVTPLVDTAKWLDLPVLQGAYTDVHFSFEHNGGLNDENGDQSPYFFNDSKVTELAVSPQELSDTFLIPLAFFNNNQTVVTEALENLAKILLEAHLLFGGLGTKSFKDSPIKGALTFASEIKTYKTAGDFLLKSKYEIENTGGLNIQVDPNKTPALDLLNVDAQTARVLPYGKLMKDVASLDSAIPQDFAVSDGSLVLIGDKAPRIYTKPLLDKNQMQVSITWFVGGLPASKTISTIGKGATTT